MKFQGGDVVVDKRTKRVYKIEYSNLDYYYFLDYRKHRYCDTIKTCEKFFLKMDNVSNILYGK